MFTVAHFRTPFLSLSETFIYSVLTALEPDMRAVVFTRERQNADKFPFAPIALPPPVGSADWLIDRSAWHFWGERHRAMSKRVLQEGARVLHAHFGSQGWDLLSVRRRTGLPMITSFYGYDASLLPRIESWRRRYADLFSQGDLFLVEGPRMKEALIELGCPRTKVRLQRIAVDVAAIPFRERRPRGDAPVTFLFCGRFVEKKGLIYALKAFDRVRAAGRDNFRFRIVGDGERAEELRDFAAGHLEDRAIFLGLLSYKEFKEELQNADAFIAPSVTAASGDTEGGAPTVILEAQAAGLPIVATRHADIPYVTDPDSALLSEERDVEALAQNIRTLIDSPERRAVMGRTGRAHIERYHDIKTEIINLKAIYRELAEKKSPVAAAS